MGLLSFLFGGGNQAPNAAPVAAQANAPVPAGPNVVGTPAPSPSGNPIDIMAKDAFQPKGESFLGKIGDVLLMLDGQKPIFHDRTVAANERAALQNYYQNPGQSQAVLGRRLESVPGADPNFAPNEIEGMNRANYFQQYGKMRADESHNTGLRMLSGIAATLMNPNTSNPDQIYANGAQAQMQKIAQMYDIDPSLVPDKYNPDALNSLAGAGTTPYDQYRESYMDTAQKNTQQYRGDMEDLRKAELGIQAANAQTHAAEAQSTIQKNTQGSLYQRQNYYQKVLGPAAKVPWLYGGFVNGTFGSGSSGVPRPGTAYISPDKTAAVKMDANGKWQIYDLRGAKVKGSSFYGAKRMGTIGGGATPTPPTPDEADSDGSDFQ